MISVAIKNSGKTYTFELPDDATGLMFKQAIFKDTGIPIDRQKILAKGGAITNEALCASAIALSKQPIMVLGTASTMNSTPVPKPIFSEDLSTAQTQVSNEPLGLLNVGNTCYLNATLQALFSIDDVVQTVLQGQIRPTNSSSDSTSLICNSLKNVFKEMKANKTTVNPTLFLTVFRNVFPQFAERGEGGMFKQQDAEEALTQLVGLLNSRYPLEDIFRIDFKTAQKCLGAPLEAEQEGFEQGNKLNCHIDIKTNFLRDGILAGLTEQIEKHLQVLDANSTYEIKRTITRLPKFLTVQFVRFFWKRDTQKKSKILRRVQFPFELDVADMLDTSIKAEKVKARDAIRVVEKNIQESVRDYHKRQKTEAKMSPVEQKEMHDAAVASIRDKFRSDLANALPDVPDLSTTTENPLLVYELTAVITHAGALADLGHYQSFVKDSSDLDGERWWKFNDDKVSAVLRDRIEQLSGGGESDSALILIYKAVGL